MCATVVYTSDVYKNVWGLNQMITSNQFNTKNKKNLIKFRIIKSYSAHNSNCCGTFARKWRCRTCCHSRFFGIGVRRLVVLHSDKSSEMKADRDRRLAGPPPLAQICLPKGDAASDITSLIIPLPISK